MYKEIQFLEKKKTVNERGKAELWDAELYKMKTMTGLS